MSKLKNLLLLSAKQRKLCKRLETCRGRLYRMAFAWSHNDAITDDVVRETMIKAMRSVDKVINIDTLDGWLFRILSNCYIEYCISHHGDVDINNIIPLQQATAGAVHSQNEMLASVRLAIACLPFKQRQVITLIDIECFSYAEVGSILDAPQGTIMSRLSRARQSLKHILNENKSMEPNISLKVVR